MGVDISRLSPAAQKQVYEKLLKSRQNGAGELFGAGGCNLASEEKVAQKASKYGNKKVEVNGIQFDSKKEARRYLDLRAMEIAGQIQNLRLQVPFELIPAQRIDGKVVERAVSYVSDFTYYDKAGNFIVEDTKGYKTPEYRLKKKMMLFFHGVRITEV